VCTRGHGKALGCSCRKRVYRPHPYSNNRWPGCQSLKIVGHPGFSSRQRVFFFFVASHITNFAELHVFEFQFGFLFDGKEYAAVTQDVDSGALGRNEAEDAGRQECVCEQALCAVRKVWGEVVGGSSRRGMSIHILFAYSNILTVVDIDPPHPPRLPQLLRCPISRHPCARSHAQKPLSRTQHRRETLLGCDFSTHTLLFPHLCPIL
jgi:hypothetical protein